MNVCSGFWIAISQTQPVWLYRHPNRGSKRGYLRYWLAGFSQHWAPSLFLCKATWWEMSELQTWSVNRIASTEIQELVAALLLFQEYLRNSNIVSPQNEECSAKWEPPTGQRWRPLESVAFLQKQLAAHLLYYIILLSASKSDQLYVKTGLVFLLWIFETV